LSIVKIFIIYSDADNQSVSVTVVIEHQF